MHYDYEKFTPDRFQEFCQALLSSEMEGVQCFPVGQKDGGRDAENLRDGAIFQVKFKRERLNNDDTFKLLKQAIDKELEKIRRLIARGATRYVLMTNLGGTAALDVGSMDKARAYLSSHVSVPTEIWFRYDLDSRLDSQYDLKWIYSEILTGPDVLRGLIEQGLGENADRRSLAISGYLTAQYELDAQVKFKQADLQASDLLELFIDVPMSRRQTRQIDENRARKLALVFRRVLEDEESSSAYLRTRRQQAGGATVLLHPASQGHLDRLIIEGAPGQGKSTLAQFVCQVNRMKFLGKSSKLNEVPARFRLGPARVPFKVDLRDLSAWLQGHDPATGVPLESNVIRSLESYLSAQISHLSGGQQFSVDDLNLFLSRTSSLVFLDGLDEVASHSERRAVIDAVSAAANRFRETCPRLQMVVTSRPAAATTTPTFSEKNWDYVGLDAIHSQLAIEYTARWCGAKRMSRQDVEEVQGILRAKLSMPHIIDLSRNAMQLTILLNLISVRGQALPDHRTELYDKYVDVFFNRESEKSRIVLENRQLLVDLHGFLAWQLHATAEGRNSTGRFSEQELRDAIEYFVSSREYRAGVLDDLFNGVIQRVVALVSRVEGTFEFEVQPLREYFAARHLYNTAPYSPAGQPASGTKPEILTALYSNPYWLNVTRFYAGCYSVGELSGLADQIQDSLAITPAGLTSFPRGVATALLADRVFSQSPRVTSRVTGAVIDGLSFRYGFWSHIIRPSSFPLTLPSDCGLDEVAEGLMARALSDLPPTLRYETALLMSVVVPSEVRGDLWLNSRPDEGERLADWLSVGVHLNSICLLDNADARRLAASDPEAQDLLARGGHPAMAESATTVRHLAERMADGSADFGLIGGPLAGLSWALSPTRFEVLRHSDAFASTDEFEPAHGGPSGLVDSGLQRLVRGLRDNWSNTRTSFLTSRIPWDEALELIEKEFGNSWLGWRISAAAFSALSRDPSSVPQGSSSALNMIIDAADRRMDAEWWESADFAPGRLGDRVKLHLILSLGTPRVLRHNARHIEQILDRLAVWEFEQILSASRYLRGSSIKTKDAQSLMAVASPRFCLAVASRSTDKVMTEWSSELDLSALQRDRLIAERGLSHALAYPPSRRSSLKEWTQWLDRVRRFNRFGGDMYVGFTSAQMLPALPFELAVNVLEAESQYPSAVVAWSDRIVSMRRERTVAAVLSIAQKQNWAAN